MSASFPSKVSEPLERRSTRDHLAETKPAITAERVLSLRAEGLEWHDIAERFGRSVSGVRDLVTKRKQKARAKEKAARR